MIQKIRFLSMTGIDNESIKYDTWGTPNVASAIIRIEDFVVKCQ